MKINNESRNDQRVFGDKAVNNTGNNGYGYEEVEQYVSSQQDTNRLDISDNVVSKPFILVDAGEHAHEVEKLANEFRIEFVGYSYFDDGSSISEDSIDKVSLNFKNEIPTKTKAFVNRIAADFPDVIVEPMAENTAGHGMDLFGSLDLSEFDSDLSQGM